jgi:beta-lactamase regulating signal transducer with metallopeptidase domain
MIKRLKLMILSLSYMFAFALPVAISAPAYAALTPQETHANLCQGSNLDLTAAGSSCPTNTGTNVTDVIKKIINILSVLIGAIAVVMIIIGGFRYVTSAGNPEGTKGARNTILYAIVGLVVVALAQIIVHFVLNSVTPTE